MANFAPEKKGWSWARQTQVWSKQSWSRASFVSAEALTEPQEDELNSLNFGIKQVIQLHYLVAQRCSSVLTWWMGITVVAPLPRIKRLRWADAWRMLSKALTAQLTIDIIIFIFPVSYHEPSGYCWHSNSTGAIISNPRFPEPSLSPIPSLSLLLPLCFFLHPFFFPSFSKAALSKWQVKQ